MKITESYRYLKKVVWTIIPYFERNIYFYNIQYRVLNELLTVILGSLGRNSVYVRELYVLIRTGDYCTAIMIARIMITATPSIAVVKEVVIFTNMCENWKYNVLHTENLLLIG